ncbi:hypothetical protein D1007_56372 [Hordeum vulgare]|nr:hypothetical protein D1007_56372 [Hordeum vulgare]
MSDDQLARQVFDNLVMIKVGEGSRVLFWKDRWIHGFAIFDIAPLIYSSVDTRTRKRRTVQEALDNNRWLQDIHGNISFTVQLQLMHLGHAIGSVQRDAQMSDIFSWPCDN